MIGFVGLSHPLWFPAKAHEVKVGWRLHPAFWGHGYATEGGRAALSAASRHLDLTRIIAVIDPRNTPSIAVATRLGLTLEESLPHPQAPGVPVDIYAIALSRPCTPASRALTPRPPHPARSRSPAPPYHARVPGAARPHPPRAAVYPRALLAAARLARRAYSALAIIRRACPRRPPRTRHASRSNKSACSLMPAPPWPALATRRRTRVRPGPAP